MSVTQLIYRSQPFGFDDAMLNGILNDSRRNNTRDDITGCLIVRADLYLQLIEGASDAIEALYSRILRDNRHLAAERLVHGEVPGRMFPDWAMRDDPARSWLWSPAEVADGAIGRASPLAVRAVFERVAHEAV